MEKQNNQYRKLLLNRAYVCTCSLFDSFTNINAHINLCKLYIGTVEEC